MTDINKGTELMLRGKTPVQKESPVLKRLGTETIFSLLRRKFRFKLELSWEKVLDN